MLCSSIAFLNRASAVVGGDERDVAVSLPDPFVGSFAREDEADMNAGSVRNCYILGSGGGTGLIGPRTRFHVKDIDSLSGQNRLILLGICGHDFDCTPAEKASVDSLRRCPSVATKRQAPRRRMI